MSEVLWCDRGNHLFSANDPELKTWTERQSYLEQQAGAKPARNDICGPCQVHTNGRDLVALLMPPKSKLTVEEIDDSNVTVSQPVTK
jgi:hypothetical protein